MKLGILGGTFDPVHNAHLALAEAVYRSLSLTRVLFVPAGDPPHKQNRPITPAVHRLKMVALAVAGFPYFGLSTVDVERPGPHYSADMVAELQAEYGAKYEDTFFIIGADSLLDFPYWRQPERLLQMCRLAVAHRPGYQPDLTSLVKQIPALARRVITVVMPGNPISATSLRKQIAAGEPVEGQIPQPVMQYIQSAGLYQNI